MVASTLDLGPYRYRPGRQLDETRMSTLWLAGEVSRDGTVSPGDQVIIKIARMTDKQYSLTNQRAIENEEKWLVHLNHPNVVRLRPVAERQSTRQTVYRARSELPGNPWFLVTDYLAGGDLQSVLNERRKLPASLALEITEQLGDALTYLHAHNCVHSDIKPRNILFHERPMGYGLTEATRPIVIDFGIAKNPTDGPQLASGTPRWITPELHEAMRVGRKLEVDPSWDLYAAGLVLYTMLSGRKPELDAPGSHSWIPLTVDDLAGDVSVKQPRQLVDGLNRLIALMTADLPDDRIHATQFAAEVARLRQHVRKPAAQAQARSGAASPAASSGARHRSGSKGLLLALGGAAAAMVLAGILIFANPNGILSGVSPTATLPQVAAVPGNAPGDGGPVEPMTSTPTAPAAAPAESAGDGASGSAAAARAPTSTAVNTPPRTPTPTITATLPPTKQPPTATQTKIPPTATHTAAAKSAIKTSTPVPPTKTPVPTRTPTRAPAVAATAAPAATRRPAATGEMQASITEPADGTVARGPVRFAWTPSRALRQDECFEVSFWEGGPGNWQNGWGIWGANRDNAIVRDFSSDFDAQVYWLSAGSTYSWGVLLIEDCKAYSAGQGSPRRLVSDVRTFTFGK